MFEWALKIIGNPSDEISVPKPTNTSPIAVETGHASYPSIHMVMINSRPNPIRPSPKTDRTMPPIKFFVLIFIKPVDPLDALPPRPLFLLAQA